MQRLISHLHTGSKSVSYLLGGLVIALGISVYVTSLTINEVTSWTINVFGLTFIIIFLLFIFIGFYCWSRIILNIEGDSGKLFWAESGLHVANALSTLALTYTLLGISLGIGTLTTVELTPDTIQTVIKSLTEHFSMAFLTTVIGLPAAAGMRALIGITAAKLITPV